MLQAKALMSEFDNEEADVMKYRHPEAPIDAGKLEEWSKAERTVLHALHPSGFALAAIVSIKNELEKVPLKFDKEVEDKLFLFEDISTSYNSPVIIRLANEWTPILSRCNTSITVSDLALEISEKILDVASDESMDEQSFTVAEIYAIWECVRMLYFQDTSESSLPELIMKWLNNTDPQPPESDGEEIMSKSSPCRHPRFWLYVTKLVSRGLFKEAAFCLTESDLVETNSEYSVLVDTLVSILQNAPKYSRDNTYRETKYSYQQKFREWRGEIVQLSSACSLDIDSTNPVIAGVWQILELLKGNNEAILQVSENWQECLALTCLVKDPLSTDTRLDIQSILEPIIKGKSGLPYDTTSVIETIFVDLFSGNCLHALELTFKIYPVLAAIMAQFLFCSGNLEDYIPPDSEMSVRQYILLDLGSAIVTNPKLTKLALHLWLMAGEHGLPFIQLAVPNLQIKSSQEADELIVLLKMNNLDSTAQELAHSWARVSEQTGNFYDALRYYSLAKQPQKIDMLSWKLLENELLLPQSSSEEITKFLQNPDAIDSMTAIVVCPFAIFLEYRQNQNLENLATLIASECLPLKYRAAMLFEVMAHLPVKDKIQKSANSKVRRKLIFNSISALEDWMAENDHSNNLKESLLFLEQVQTSRESKGIYLCDMQKELLAVPKSSFFKEVSLRLLESLAYLDF